MTELVKKKLTEKEKQQLRDEIEQLKFQYNLKTDINNQTNTLALPFLLFLVGLIGATKGLVNTINYAFYAILLLFLLKSLWDRLDKSKNKLKEDIELKYKQLTNLDIKGKDNF